MTTSESLLLALLVIFTVPFLVWRLGRTDGWAPLVVVQILAGVALGPGVFGAALPEGYAFLFPPPVVAGLNAIAGWAVMLFVWVAGLELDLGEAWRRRRESGITAGFALGVPLLFGVAASAVLLRFPGWIGAGGAPWQALLGIGMACAVTALPILVLLLEKLELLHRPLGQRILRYASMDDVAIWAVLALILLDWTRLGRQLAFLLAFAAAAYGLRKLMARLREPDRWCVGLIWLAACGFLADWSGLHFMVGAFLAGAVMDVRGFDRRAVDGFRNVVLLALMPVFFLSTGLRTAWGLGGAAVFAAAALLLAASVAGKLVGLRLAGRVLGWAPGEASLIGWLLQTKALIMIIFSSILLDRRIITNATFTALLLMAVASTMLTVPMTRPRLARLRELVDKAA